MNLASVIALVACAIHGTTALTVFVMSRAPGWRRVRGFGYAALSAALYNAVDVWATAAPLPIERIGWVLRLNLSFAALHVASWTFFTFSNERGSWSRMVPWAKWLVIGTVGIAVPLSLSGVVVSPTDMLHLQIPELGINITGPRTSPIGDVVASATLSVLLFNVAVYVRRGWRGDASARWIAAGLVFFALCSVEEFLVTTGAVRFIFLADVGFMVALLPLAWQNLRRFIDDAGRLDAIAVRLEGEVNERTQERDDARYALQEQERLAVLGRLAAGVGHEVNNPLQYVAHSLDELRSLLGTSPSDVQAVLGDAEDGVERIRRVVEGLRVYGTGPRVEVRQPVDIRDVVRHAMRVAEPQVRHVARVEADLGPTPTVLGDEARLVQVIVNPFVNAAQAVAASSAKTGVIRVITRTGIDGSAEIEISDTGPGVPSEVRDRLGEPYVTTKARAGGTGLGIFIAQGIVHAHGGTLVVAQRTHGGTRVTVRLPAASPEAITPPAVPMLAAAAAVAAAPPMTQTPSAPTRVAPAPSAATAASRRILLVDDDPMVLQTLARALTRRGMAVDCAASGHEALSRVAQETYDAIVSDLMMPGMSGIDLEAALAESHPEARERLIILTGGAVTPAAAAFTDRADVRSFMKPVDVTALVSTLQEFPARS